jgi:hypothetical protein
MPPPVTGQEYPGTFHSVQFSLSFVVPFYIRSSLNRSIEGPFVPDPSALFPSSHDFINRITEFPFRFSFMNMNKCLGEWKWQRPDYLLFLVFTICFLLTHHISKFLQSNLFFFFFFSNRYTRHTQAYPQPFFMTLYILACVYGSSHENST